jgi:hypothetical protein
LLARGFRRFQLAPFSFLFDGALLLTDFIPAVGGETRIADLHWHIAGSIGRCGGQAMRSLCSQSGSRTMSTTDGLLMLKFPTRLEFNALQPTMLAGTRRSVDARDRGIDCLRFEDYLERT